MGESTKSRRGATAGLAGWLALCFAAAAVGGLASGGSETFYGSLVKPAWAPPSWVFGLAWTVLYVLMAYAAWTAWREQELSDATRALARRQGLTLFVLQLALNALWTWLFFRWRLGAVAMAELVLLWLLVVGVTVLFARVRLLAAWLLVPYLVWLTYAGVLNWAVWRANPGVL